MIVYEKMERKAIFPVLIIVNRTYKRGSRKIDKGEIKLGQNRTTNNTAHSYSNGSKREKRQQE